LSAKISEAPEFMQPSLRVFVQEAAQAAKANNWEKFKVAARKAGSAVDLPLRRQRSGRPLAVLPKKAVNIRLQQDEVTHSLCSVH